MSKFTIVLLVVALVSVTFAKPQGVNVIDGDQQVDVVDNNPSNVNVVDPIDVVNPRGPNNGPPPAE